MEVHASESDRPQQSCFVKSVGAQFMDTELWLPGEMYTFVSHIYYVKS